jgi:hypothetical protein
MPPRKDDSRWMHSDALPVVPLKLPQQGNGPLRRLAVHVPPPPYGAVEIGALRGGCTVHTPPTRMVIPMSAMLPMHIYFEVRWGSRRPRNSSIQSSCMAEDARFRRGCSDSIISVFLQVQISEYFVEIYLLLNLPPLCWITTKLARALNYIYKYILIWFLFYGVFYRATQICLIPDIVSMCVA